MKLSEAIRRKGSFIHPEGFLCKIMKHPARVKGGLGKGFPNMQARVYKNAKGQLGIAIMEDSWDYAYSASHEIAEWYHGFDHTADMFCNQANLLARWVRWVAMEGSK